MYKLNEKKTMDCQRIKEREAGSKRDSSSPKSKQNSGMENQKEISTVWK